ncbi:MAG TPA: hypothetical protein VIR27_13900 [Mycobacteriales bacterium]|jgi:hypothetical protein
MKYKMGFVVGLGIGYVLGARAGRQRYESIVRTARRVREHPTVQSTAGMLQAQAGSVMGTVRERLGATAHRPDGESAWWEQQETSVGEHRPERP